MLIECLLKRDAPVITPQGNETYRFADASGVWSSNGGNFAEVWIESHIEAFLAVPHLYRPLNDERQKVETVSGRPVLTMPPNRKVILAALKARGIKFKITEPTVALADRLAASQKAA